MRILIGKIRYLWSIRIQLGTLAGLRFIIAKLLQKINTTLGNRWPILLLKDSGDLVTNYTFMNQTAYGRSIESIDELKPNTINWVIPDIGMGSGGHLNIFRLISNLEKFGYKCTLIINNGSQFPSSEIAKKFLVNNFLPIKADVVIGQCHMIPAWYTFATSWQTAYTVRSFQGTRQKCYFVQDFEPWFYPPGSEYVFAEETYRFGFFGITAGSWLSEKLSAEYGMSTASMSFSYDKDRYCPLPRKTVNKKRVFYYARPSTPRRGFELGILVLDAVSKRIPNFHAILAGYDGRGYKLPFSNTNVGIAKLEDLPKIYSQCDVALVLSFSNLSLLPLEIMACGCPIVSNKGPNVEWLLNSEIATLANSTVNDLTNAIVAILENDLKRKLLVSKGLKFVKKTNWEYEAGKVDKALKSIKGLEMHI